MNQFSDIPLFVQAEHEWACARNLKGWPSPRWWQGTILWVFAGEAW